MSLDGNAEVLLKNLFTNEKFVLSVPITQQMQEVDIMRKCATIISKKKEPKKPGLFKRFIDFLVEEVDTEEEEKDKRLQEFDRKKGDKFEIKEIRELK